MSKNRLGKFWNFDPWRPQFWPEPKNDRNDFEMIFCELSNAAFRFSLRRPGAEIMGGGVQTPPPSRRWEIQRPSRARVKGLKIGAKQPSWIVILLLILISDTFPWNANALSFFFFRWVTSGQTLPSICTTVAIFNYHTTGVVWRQYFTTVGNHAIVNKLHRYDAGNCGFWLTMQAMYMLIQWWYDGNLARAMANAGICHPSCGAGLWCSKQVTWVNFWKYHWGCKLELVHI